MAVPTVLIMAAGRGTRMRSRLPKVLHPLCGRPLVLWPVEAARAAGAERIVVVLGPDAEQVRTVLPPDIEIAIQDPPAGTGDAVLAAREQLVDSKDVIVLSGDHPLLDSSFVTALARRHDESGAAATVTTRELADPGSYGRVVRAPDGDIERIVETKHPEQCTPEQLAIEEINAGAYAFDVGPLLEALDQVAPDGSQGEIFLGDALPLMSAGGGKIVAHLTDDEAVGLGINTRADLARAQRVAQALILERHMLAGVTIVNPAATVIDVDVTVGQDTTIEPFSYLRGHTEIGGDCTVGPVTTLIDSALGDGASVVCSYLDSCEVLKGCRVGPFTHIRPGTALEDGAKAGAFVEVKNSRVGEGTKIPHLAYVGDADLGPGTNIGAGTITANYDGRAKHRTVIGSGVRTGVHTSLVAPVSVGDDAYTGAGSVITEDVPAGALGIARPPQTNVEGYAERKDKDSKNTDETTKEKATGE
ncbi:MAG: bifunctional UDP-N-acetylglucosamine diphosphorylase/glucosamine-1-phosphate N-acetyltransferase GlmU [Solirubrobacterales bacterium]